MNRANTKLQRQLLYQTFAYRFQSPTIPIKQPTRFVATPRPKREPHRAPKPAPHLSWWRRNLLQLLNLACKITLMRIARWRHNVTIRKPLISDTEWCALPFVKTKGTTRTQRAKLDYGFAL